MKKPQVSALVCLSALLLGSCLMAQAQTWTSTGSMASRRADHTVTLLNSGQVLVAGGQFKGHPGLNTAEVYNPSSGTFSSTGNLNTGSQLHSATLINNGDV